MMASVDFRRGLVVVVALLAFLFIFASRYLSIENYQIIVKPHSSGPSPTAYNHIQDKVAVITDTQYTNRLIPLILHFQSILGPGWPIVFFTSEETRENHFSPFSSPKNYTGSAVWQRAVDDGLVEIRTVPSGVDLASRHGVNLYFSRPVCDSKCLKEGIDRLTVDEWFWEQLAPAEHVLIFQADSMICANSHRTLDSFLPSTFIGAPLSRDTQPKKFNGGLSLRNRPLILSILSSLPPNQTWEAETAAQTYTHGEDAWFSREMENRGVKLPNRAEALQFACQGDEHLDTVSEPFGFHKVHRQIPGRLEEIERWCPEIALAGPGALG
ncbi:hypothetical protein VTL71DRAFT_9603 [Oculimacula yallundae]|uniref:DUF5672 domain-containing protein n=1 Tax=Oculimacula yallundae TaxID=86028 RepID=A0ABR4BR96_9HELO